MHSEAGSRSANEQALHLEAQDHAARQHGKSSYIRTVAKFFDVAIDAIATLGFALMLLVTLAQVGFRYALHMPLGWTEEAARILFVQTMLLGMAIAIRTAEHVVVGVIFDRLARRPRAVASIAINIVILLFLADVIRGTIVLAADGWSIYMIELDWIRTGYLYLGQLFSLCCMAYYVAWAIVAGFDVLSARMDVEPELDRA